MIGTVATYAFGALMVLGAVIETRHRNRKIRHLARLCERVDLVLVDYYEHRGDVKLQIETVDGREDEKDGRLRMLALLLKVVPPPRGLW